MDDKLPVWDWPDWGIFTGPRLRWVARTRDPYENPSETLYRYCSKKYTSSNYRRTRHAKRKAQKMARKMQRGR